VKAAQHFGPAPETISIVYRARRVVGGGVQVDGADPSIPDRRAEVAGFGTVGIGHQDPTGGTMLWFEGVPPLTVGGTANCRWVTRSTASPFPILSESPTGLTENGDCAGPVINTRRARSSRPALPAVP
jgi:hypothetical protein